jgi:hypothetical protein
MRISKNSILLCFCLVTKLLEFGFAQNWADRWRQEAAKAALKEAAKAEIQNKQVRIVTRRYFATGEVRAIKNKTVLGTYFKYEASLRDLSEQDQKKSIKKERSLEKSWNRIRSSCFSGFANSSENHAGFLDPYSSDALAMAARDEIPGSVVVAIEFFKHLVDEVRAHRQTLLCSGPILAF